MGPSQTDRSWPELKTCWRRAPRPVRRRIGPTRQEENPRLGVPRPWAVWLIFLGRVAHRQPSTSEEGFTPHGSDAAGAMCEWGRGAPGGCGDPRALTLAPLKTVAGEPPEPSPHRPQLRGRG